MTRSLARAFAISLCLVPSLAASAPTRRFDATLRGNYFICGNNNTFDCANQPIPLGAIVDPNDCGTNTGDTAGDMFWRADYPSAGQVTASKTFTAADARTTAVCGAMPINNEGSTFSSRLVYARLYWSAKRLGSTADTEVFLDREGLPGLSVVADATNVIPAGGGAIFYQSSADVTAFVREHGRGFYRVAGIDSLEPLNLNDGEFYSAWSMAVVFEDSAVNSVMRRIVIDDGLERLAAGSQVVSNIPLLSRATFPGGNYDAHIGVVSYEGDVGSTGEVFLVTNDPLPAVLTYGLGGLFNPLGNFFNGTHAYFTAESSPSPYAQATYATLDLPGTYGQPGTFGNFDIDYLRYNPPLNTVNANKAVNTGLRATNDVVFTGVIATSVPVTGPALSRVRMSVTNLTNAGDTRMRAGDVVSYRVEIPNEGALPADRVQLSEALPVGLTYLPGSLRVVSGPTPGAKSDATNDDQGEYNALTRTLTVRLGTGANRVLGGILDAGVTTVVTFDATIDASASGTISTRATLSAHNPDLDTVLSERSHGESATGLLLLGTPTSFLISQCDNDGDCTASPGTPRCEVMAHACRRCLTSDDCLGGAACVARECVLPVPTIDSPAPMSISEAPIFSGGAGAGSTVNVYVDGISVGSTLADNTGAWQLVPGMTLALGAHTLEVDADVGQAPLATRSAKSTAISFTIATSCAPSCPDALPHCDTTEDLCVRCLADADCPSGATCEAFSCVLPPPVITSPSEGAVVVSAAPTFIGHSAPFATISLVLDGNPLGTTIADANGSFSFTPQIALALEGHQLIAIAERGGAPLTVKSLPSAALHFEVLHGCHSSSDCEGSTPVCDTAAHACVRCVTNPDCGSGATCVSRQCALAAPIIAAPTAGAVLPTTLPSFSGDAPALSTVSVRIDGATVATVTASAQGTWTAQSSVAIAAGPHSVTATARSQTAPLGITSPVSAAIAFVISSGCTSDASCSGVTPRCSVLVGACVACLDSADCAAPASCNAGYCTLAAPTFTSPASGAALNDNTPAFFGAAAPSVSIDLFIDGVLAISTTSSPSGIWTATAPALAEGTHSVTARARIAQTQSPLSAPLIITTGSDCDTNAQCNGSTPYCHPTRLTCVECVTTPDCPTGATCDASAICRVAQPTFLSPTNFGTYVTSDSLVTFTGLAVAGATVVLLVDDLVVAQTVANASGAYEIRAASPIAPGIHVVQTYALIGIPPRQVQSPRSSSIQLTVTAGCSHDSDCGGASPVCDSTRARCVACAAPSYACPLGASCTFAGSCFVSPPGLSSPTSDFGAATARPTFSGYSTPGATITAYIDGAYVGSAISDSGGFFSFLAGPIPPDVDYYVEHQYAVYASVGVADARVVSSPALGTYYGLPGCSFDSDCALAQGGPFCDAGNHTCVSCRDDSHCPAGGTCAEIGGTHVCRIPFTLASPLPNASLAYGFHIIGDTLPGADVKFLLLPQSTSESFTADSAGHFDVVLSIPVLYTSSELYGYAYVGNTLSDPVRFPFTYSSSCNSDAQCAPRLPRCNTTTHVCQECILDAHCPSGFTCAANLCRPPMPTIVSPADGSFVSKHFTVTGTAPPNANVVMRSPLTGLVTSSTFADGTGNYSLDVTTDPFVGNQSFCAYTVAELPARRTESFAACANYAFSPSCDSSLDCPAPTTVCDTALHTCTECLSDGDCPNGAECQTGYCVPGYPSIVDPPYLGQVMSHRPRISGTARPGASLYLVIYGALGEYLEQFAVADSNGDWVAYPWTAIGPGTIYVDAYTLTTESFNNGQFPVTSIQFEIVDGCSSSAECSDVTPICDGGACLQCLSDTDCPVDAYCVSGGCQMGAQPQILTPTENTVATPFQMTGSAHPGSTVIVTTNYASVGVPQADGSGTWSLQIPKRPPGASETFYIQETSGAGPTLVQSSFYNGRGYSFSTSSGGCTSVSDCPLGTACNNNVCEAPAPVITSHVQGGTYAGAKAIAGTAIPNRAVHVFAPFYVGTAFSDSLGHWSITPLPPLAVGSRTLSAQLDWTPFVESAHIDIVIDQLGCSSSAQCSPTKPECDLASARCGHCASNAACPVDKPFCVNAECGEDPPIVIISPAAGATLHTRYPTLSGTAAPSAAIYLAVNDGSAPAEAQTISDPTGNWSVTMRGQFPEGSYTINATAVTNAGRREASVRVTIADGCSVSGDCLPGAPQCETQTGRCFACSTPADCAPGMSCTDSMCSLATPILTAPAQHTLHNDHLTLFGTAAPNTAVDFFFDAYFVGSATVDGSGSWTFGPPDRWPLELEIPFLGEYYISARARSGNVVSLSSFWTFKLFPACSLDDDCARYALVCDTTTSTCRECTSDGQCPAGATCDGELCKTPAPTILSPASGSTVATRLPIITGSSVADASVVVSIDGIPQPPRIADAAGDFSLAPLAPLAPGAHTITAVSTITWNGDAIVSPTSAPVPFTVVDGCLSDAMCSGVATHCNVATHICVRCFANSDCASGATCDALDCAIPAPQITSPLDRTSVSSLQPTLTGSTVPAATVRLFVDGVYAGVVTANATGAFSIAPNLPLTIGAHTFFVTATLGDGPTAIVARSVDRVLYLLRSCVTASDCVASSPICLSSGVCGRCVSAADCPTGATCRLASNECELAPPQLIAPIEGTAFAAPPTVSGTSVAGASITLLIDGAATTTTIADASGAFRFAPTLSLSLGIHNVAALAHVGEGAVAVTSRPSPARNFIIAKACEQSSDCPLTTPVCFVAEQRCVACISDSDCTQGARCSDSRCALDAPTITAPTDGAQLMSIGQILGSAVANAQLTILIDGLSVGTTTSDGLGTWQLSPAVTLSSGAHLVSAIASVGAGPSLVLSPTSAVVHIDLIASCMGSGACTGTTPLCDVANSRCVQCLVDGDCPSGATCAANLCTLAAPTISSPTAGAALMTRRPTISGTSAANAQMILIVDAFLYTLSASSDGSFSFPLPVDLTNGAHTVSARARVTQGAITVTSANSAATAFTISYVCSSDSECGEASPRCDLGTGACVACLIGVTPESGCAERDIGHRCLPDSMGGVTCGCDADVDCGSPLSGRVCDPVAHRCTDGCSALPGRNGCPTDQYCSASATSTGAGLCTTACNSDQDCAGELPRCVDLGSAALHLCVECATDSDCVDASDNRRLCRPDTHRCVECTATSTQSCSPVTNSGGACLANDRCGCSDDDDCGPPESQLVCGIAHVCVTGCRTADCGMMPDAGAPDLANPELPPGVTLEQPKSGGCATNGPPSDYAVIALALACLVIRSRSRSRSRF